MASPDLREELECSICLTLYTDPVILRCGHNFCRVCINQVLNTQVDSGDYSCPECREEFQERPTLMRNVTLCNVAERFRSTQTHQEEITGICCTYCIHSPVPAVRSCLHCEASLCDNHMRVHSKGPEHVLTDPSTSLETRRCSVHKKILKYYCTEDAACICVSCSLAGEHRGHRVEMLDEASEKKKKKLRNVLQKLITKRKKTEERVRSLEEQRRKAQERAAGEAESVTALFIEIRRRVDDLEKRILSDISRWEEQESLSLSDVIQNLEIKKEELSRKMRHIEELCNVTDPLTVLQEPDTSDLWCLSVVLGYNNQYSVIHNSKVIPLCHQMSSDRVRIYLDYEAGQLSFYELCDPIKHLHTITAAFSEPLHAVLCVCDGSVKILGRSCEELS